MSCRLADCEPADGRIVVARARPAGHSLDQNQITHSRPAGGNEPALGPSKGKKNNEFAQTAAAFRSAVYLPPSISGRLARLRS